MNFKRKLFWYVFLQFFLSNPITYLHQKCSQKNIINNSLSTFLPYKVRRCCLSFRPFKKCKQWWRFLKQCQPIIFVLKKNSINEIICVYPTKGYQKYVFPDLTDTTKSAWLCSCTGYICFKFQKVIIISL